MIDIIFPGMDNGLVASFSKGFTDYLSSIIPAFYSCGSYEWGQLVAQIFAGAILGLIMAAVLCLAFGRR